MTTINVSDKVKAMLDDFKEDFETNTYSDTLLVLIISYKHLKEKQKGDSNSLIRK